MTLSKIKKLLRSAGKNKKGEDLWVGYVDGKKFTMTTKEWLQVNYDHVKNNPKEKHKAAHKNFAMCIEHITGKE